MKAAESWMQAYPGAMVGCLALSGVENPAHNTALEGRARDLEADLRRRFSGFDRSAIASMPCVQAYAQYYRSFGKTYHLLLQLESVVFKNKPIAAPNTLVQAMFMAEMKNMLLTAGHDLAAVHGSLVVDVSAGTEAYTSLGGKTESLKAKDMFIRDDTGIISSILYGPDQRTRITPDTTEVIYVVYAPPGTSLDDLEAHLNDLEANTAVFSPEAEVMSRQVLVAA
jgi:DNA/RNA-binding domain of Phe-tRNA-synthetase-like protein